jgi:ATP-dependent RNA helicase DeaD
MTSPDTEVHDAAPTFADLQIHPSVLQAVADVGY